MCLCVCVRDRESERECEGVERPRVGLEEKESQCELRLQLCGGIDFRNRIDLIYRRSWCECTYDQAHETLEARANMAHTRQSRPDSGLGLQVKVLKTREVVPSWLDSGTLREIDLIYRQSSCGWSQG